jgi:arabinofuranosyltransferase
MSIILWLKEKMNNERSVKYFCFVFFLLFVVLNAWQADDAYHSHKMSYNFANGNGLVYNVGERVSASTEPLNTILVGIAYKLSGHMYLSSMLLCFVFSFGAVLILFNAACKGKRDIILITLLLVFCQSFISYTTSGLENSLLFFLFSLLLYIYFRSEIFDKKSILLSAFVVSLILMARMDNALLAFPILLFVLIKRKNTNLIMALFCIFLGLLPFIAWEIFSVFYYGFPFPNTAYAKLGTDIPLADYVIRGIKYFIGAFSEDPVVLVFPALFIIQSITSKSFKYTAISAGIVLYYMYLIYIGGDFMFGRHFTVPFFVSIFGLFVLFKTTNKNVEQVRFLSFFEKEKGDNKARGGGMVITVLLVASLALRCLTMNAEFRKYLRRDDIDERQAYFSTTSFVRNVYWILRNKPVMELYKQLWDFTPVEQAQALNYQGDIITFAPGILMLYGTDNIYINDTFALGDPFLARLPAVYTKDWRIGHMQREIPDGYRESIQTGENKVKDTNLAEYLDIIWEITRSKDIFSKSRIQKIIKINLGEYNYLIGRYYRKQTSK